MSRPGGANNSNHDPGLHNSGAQQHVDVNAIDERFRRLYKMHSLGPWTQAEYASELTRSPKPKVFLQFSQTQERQVPRSQDAQTGGREDARPPNDDTLRAAEGLTRIRTSAPIEMRSGIRATSNDKRTDGSANYHSVPQPVQNGADNRGGFSSNRQNQFVRSLVASGNQQGLTSGVANRSPHEPYGHRSGSRLQDSNSPQSPTPGTVGNGLRGSNNQHNTANRGAPEYGPMPPPDWSADRFGTPPVARQSGYQYAWPIRGQNETQLTTGDGHKRWHGVVHPQYSKMAQPSTRQHQQILGQAQQRPSSPSLSTTTTQQQHLAPSVSTTPQQQPLASSVRTTTDQYQRLAPSVVTTTKQQRSAPSVSTATQQQQNSTSFVITAKEQPFTPPVGSVMQLKKIAPSVSDTTRQQQHLASSASTTTQKQHSAATAPPPVASPATQPSTLKPSDSTVTSTPSGINTTTAATQEGSQRPSGIPELPVAKSTTESDKAKEETLANKKTISTPDDEPVPGSIAATLQFLKQNRGQDRNTASQEPHKGGAVGGTSTVHEKAPQSSDSASPNASSNSAATGSQTPVSKSAGKEASTSSAKEQHRGGDKMSATRGISSYPAGPGVIGSAAATKNNNTSAKVSANSSPNSTSVKPTHSNDNVASNAASTPTPSVQGNSSQGVTADANQHKNGPSSTTGNVGLGQQKAGLTLKFTGHFEGRHSKPLASTSSEIFKVRQRVTGPSTSAQPASGVRDRGTPSSLPRKPVTNSTTSGRAVEGSSPTNGASDARKGNEVTTKVTKSTPSTQETVSIHTNKPAEHQSSAVVPVRTKSTGEPRTAVDESDPRIRYVKEVERQLLQRQKVNKGQLSKSLMIKSNERPAMINSRTVQKGISAEDSLLNQVAARAAEAFSAKAGKNGSINQATKSKYLSPEQNAILLTSRYIDEVGKQSDQKKTPSSSDKDSDAKGNYRVQAQLSSSVQPTKATLTTSPNVTKVGGQPAEGRQSVDLEKTMPRPPNKNLQSGENTSMDLQPSGNTSSSADGASERHKEGRFSNGNDTRTYISSSSLRIKPEEMNQVEEGEEEESLFMTPPPDEVRSPDKIENNVADVQQEQSMITNQRDTHTGITGMQVNTISSDEDEPMEPPERAPEPVNYEAMLSSLGPTLDDIDAKTEDPADEVPTEPATEEVQGTTAEVDAWNASNREENFYKDDEVDDWEPPELPDNDSDEDFVMEDSDDNDDRPLSQFVGPKNSEAYLQTVVRSQPLKKSIKDKASSKKRKTETPQKTPTNKRAKVIPKSVPARKKPTSSAKKSSATKKETSSPSQKPSPKKQKQRAKTDKDFEKVGLDDGDSDDRSKRMSSEFRKLESSLVGKLFDLPSGGRRRSTRY